jgi:hypothetical protein
VKDDDCADRGNERRSGSPIVAKHAPVFEPRECVLYPYAPPSVPSPHLVADDPASPKPWDFELAEATVSAVSENASMLSTECLDARASVVHRIIAIARTAAIHGDDA